MKWDGEKIAGFGLAIAFLVFLVLLLVKLTQVWFFGGSW
jgi:hypothetical protein